MITPEQLSNSGSESGQQKALFCWCNQNLDKYPELKWLFAIPNGGLRDSRTAGKLKAEGVKAGVWDIFLPVRKIEAGIIVWSGLWIEMKIRPNKLTLDQGRFGEYVMSQGYKTAVCYSWQEARDHILEYLGKK